MCRKHRPTVCSEQLLHNVLKAFKFLSKKIVKQGSEQSTALSQFGNKFDFQFCFVFLLALAPVNWKH